MKKLYIILTIFVSITCDLRADEKFGFYEYPLAKLYPQLIEFPVICWSNFQALEDDSYIRGQIDGFFKVIVNKDETIVALYKSKEDMKYRRLASCLYIVDVNFSEIQGANIKSLKEIEGRYGIVSGVFNKTTVNSSSLGGVILLTGVYLNSSPIAPKKK